MVIRRDDGNDGDQHSSDFYYGNTSVKHISYTSFRVLPDKLCSSIGRSTWVADYLYAGGYSTAVQALQAEQNYYAQYFYSIARKLLMGC